MSNINQFELAGTELSWPIGIAAGMTNHPDIEVVARRFEDYVGLGVGEVVLGSWKLGEASGGNAHVRIENSKWDHLGGDEHVDTDEGISYNAKGLPGPGIEAGLERLPDFIELARSKDTEVSLSVSPHTQKPLEEVPELLNAAAKALSAGVLRVEFNLSCPNVPERPPFYLDSDSVRQFMIMTSSWRRSLRNRFGHPGLYAKFGPMGNTADEAMLRDTYWGHAGYGVFGGVVTSNTVPGQHEAIKVNDGKAGQGGPHFIDVGRQQLNYWTTGMPGTDVDTISALGVSSGREVAVRAINWNANLCQLASAVHWPGLVGEESAGAVVEKTKGQFVDIVS